MSKLIASNSDIMAYKIQMIIKIYYKWFTMKIWYYIVWKNIKNDSLLNGIVNNEGNLLY